MLIEYINEAVATAKYDIIDDEEPYYGEIPLLKGVWATGKNLEECRNNLIETLEGWLYISIKKGLNIPAINDKKIEVLVLEEEIV